MVRINFHIIHFTYRVNHRLQQRVAEIMLKRLIPHYYYYYYYYYICGHCITILFITEQSFDEIAEWRYENVRMQYCKID